MKYRKLALISLLLLFAACTEIDDRSSQENTLAKPSYNISLSDINKIDFSRMISPQTKAGGTLSKEITPIVEEADTLLYIINYGKGDGWLLASADKRLPLINALSKTGRFDLETAARNKALMTWIDELKENARFLKQNPSFVPDTTTLVFWNNPDSVIKTKGSGEGDAHEGEWLQLVYVAMGTDCHYDIGHLMDTQWGPGHPWNTCLPYDGNGNRCETSQGVVATAQLAYYYHYYSGKPLTAYEYGTCTTNWNQTSDLQLYNSSSSNWAIMPVDSSSSSTTGKQAVAALMASIGEEVSAVYLPSGGVSSPSLCADYLDDCGLSITFGAYNNDTVLYNLQQGWPVYLSFQDNAGVYFDVVIDGMKVYAQRTTYYYQWMPIGTYPPVEPEYPDLNHPELYEIYDYWGPNTSYWSLINWGLDGLYDSGEYNLAASASFVPPVYFPTTSMIMYHSIH